MDIYDIETPSWCRKLCHNLVSKLARRKGIEYSQFQQGTFPILMNFFIYVLFYICIYLFSSISLSVLFISVIILTNLRGKSVPYIAGEGVHPPNKTAKLCKPQKWRTSCWRIRWWNPPGGWGAGGQGAGGPAVGGSGVRGWPQKILEDVPPANFLLISYLTGEPYFVHLNLFLFKWKT